MSRQAELSEPSDRLQVVAGILRDRNGRVLITERLADHAMAGKWEFPGGKVLPGEEHAQALQRELLEELDVEALHCSHLVSLRHDYPDRKVEINFYLVGEWRRQPRGCDGQALAWVDPEELDPHRLLAADAPVIDLLRKSAHVLR